MSDEDPVEDEAFEMLNSFTTQVGRLAEAAKDVEVLLPAIIIIARMWLISNLKQDGKFKSRKELIYYIERELIGAWIVKNSSSSVGEGAGIALMATAPFAEAFGDMASGAAEKSLKDHENMANRYQEIWQFLRGAVSGGTGGV